jgi:predicted TPR repeat methyltransferase
MNSPKISKTWSESRNMDDLHKRALDGDMVAYDAWAPIYEKSVVDIGYKGPEIFAERFVQNLEQENSHLHEKDLLSVLDIGCGTGLIVDAILKTSKMVGRYVFTGADIHQGMLKYAEDKGTYQDLQKIDLNNASLDGKYDVIISSGTFIEGHVKLEKIFDLLE